MNTDMLFSYNETLLGLLSTCGINSTLIQFFVMTFNPNGVEKFKTTPLQRANTV
jgi:hypothetical protein